jgi:iron-sulfur cluster assembly accessory protein
MDRLTVSDSAAKRIGKIIEKEAGMSALRISVEGGGCSGFSYKFDLVPQVQADDLVFEKNGAKVVVDPVSIDYMDGSELDFVDNLMGQSFQVKNPLATASCGCGTSFSL